MRRTLVQGASMGLLRRVRMRRVLALVVAAVLAFIVARDCLTHHKEAFNTGESDRVVSLLSEIG